MLLVWQVLATGTSICRPTCDGNTLADTTSDYSLNNPDTLTKYKEAAKISQKVLEAVSGMETLWVTYITIKRAGIHERSFAVITGKARSRT